MRGPLAVGLAIAAGLVVALALLFGKSWWPGSSAVSVSDGAAEGARASVATPEAVAVQHPEVSESGVGWAQKTGLGANNPHHWSQRLEWKDLTAAEQAALAPLAGDWDKLEIVRRRKWVEIAKRFPEWTPEEQKRRQDRMRELARLTPEERRVARDTIARAQALPPEKRAELFRQYQDLPEERKLQLAAEAKATHSVVPVKPLPPRHQPVPIKAQIREGSTQKVPGPPEVASKSPRPSAPLPTPASSVSTDSSVNPGTGVVPNAPPQGANAVSSPSSPSAPALATPASAPGASSP